MNTPNPFVALVSGMGKAMPPLESGFLFQTGETADGKTPLLDGRANPPWGLRRLTMFFGRQHTRRADHPSLDGLNPHLLRGLFLGGNDPLAGKIFTVNKFELGYVYNLPKTGHIRWGIGVAGSVDVLPHELDDRYTSLP